MFCYAGLRHRRIASSRRVKQEQEEISLNHIKTLFSGSLHRGQFLVRIWFSYLNEYPKRTLLRAPSKYTSKRHMNMFWISTAPKVIELTKKTASCAHKEPRLTLYSREQKSKADRVMSGYEFCRRIWCSVDSEFRMRYAKRIIRYASSSFANCHKFLPRRLSRLKAKHVFTNLVATLIGKAVNRPPHDSSFPLPPL